MLFTMFNFLKGKFNLLLKPQLYALHNLEFLISS